jgi:hypothetical protein
LNGRRSILAYPESISCFNKAKPGPARHISITLCVFVLNFTESFKLALKASLGKYETEVLLENYEWP